ncbi:hypothetical protein ALI22I_10020 [Saccharothrix sp. ALI-22-I]|uniref:hypothetical protein n=1 Tax=Saccharothrix sp. ALI-22-I TaxID=1933778 RepID=UPI00097C368E|nr:hypothetical protein [Saccharothrix sp. ALI-22-I]ONI91095.1 hypothetical protein ALI22I_10020 [Saccharothrix sp. ALI-22-I]
MPFTASRGLVRQTERWFVRRGAPTMIEGYSFVGHVLSRMLPTSALVTLASLAWRASAAGSVAVTSADGGLQPVTDLVPGPVCHHSRRRRAASVQAARLLLRVLTLTS